MKGSLVVKESMWVVVEDREASVGHSSLNTGR